MMVAMAMSAVPTEVEAAEVVLEEDTALSAVVVGGVVPESTARVVKLIERHREIRIQ